MRGSGAARRGAAVGPGEPETLPPVNSYVINGITDWLYGRERMQRRPEATAKVLWLVCTLHKERIPWPTRPAVSNHLGVSMPLVDVAISQRRADGLLTVVIETKRGHVKQRASVVTDKYIEPSEELFKVFRDAEKAQKKILRKEAATAAKTVALVTTGATALCLAQLCCACFFQYI
jgi:hypothetical protein